MEEHTSLIEVGESYVNHTGRHIVARSVTTGKHGLLVEGRLTDNGDDTKAYLPYELPPVEAIAWGWHGWGSRHTITLISGQKVGVVCYMRDSPNGRRIQDYDIEWEHTIEAMKPEEGVMQSRPTEIRLN